MAGRIRSLKPELLEDSKAGQLTDGAWRLWVSSLLLADDYGNFRAHPAQLAGQVFWGSPRTAASVGELLRELAGVRLLALYEVNGQLFASITGWGKHQRVDNAGKPRCPKPAEGVEILRDSPRLAEIVGGSPPDLRPPIPTTDPDHRGGARGGGSLAAGPAAPQPTARSRRTKSFEASPEEQSSLERIIAKLNERTGREYEPGCKETRRKILSLLRGRRDGQTLPDREKEIRLVVWHKANEWAGEERWSKFLRPKTLFGAENFADYVVEARAAWAVSSDNPDRTNGHRRVEGAPGAGLQVLAEAVRREGMS